MNMPTANESKVKPIDCNKMLIEGSVALTSGVLNNAMKGVTGLIATKKDRLPFSASGLYKIGET
jgi:hypothetical protein